MGSRVQPKLFRAELSSISTDERGVLNEKHTDFNRFDHAYCAHLFDSEANVAVVIEPHRHRIPVGHENPLPEIELASGDDQRVLKS